MEELHSLPKAVLHDHLDGGLRVATILELAESIGYDGLPSSEEDELRNWFHQGESGSLERYLAAFTHTLAVMQTADAIERVAYEAIIDLAADGVVYAEQRFAPSLNTEGGLSPKEVVAAAASGVQAATARGLRPLGQPGRLLARAKPWHPRLGAQVVFRVKLSAGPGKRGRGDDPARLGALCVFRIMVNPVKVAHRSCKHHDMARFRGEFILGHE